MFITHFGIDNTDQIFFEQAFGKLQQTFIKQDQINLQELSNPESIEILSVFVHTIVDKETIQNLPNLKLIVTRSTGFDHIDINECKKRNILVCNVPNYGENTVAEHTFAMLLSMARKIPQLSKRVHNHNLDYKDLLGSDLQGKTLGIIGAGHIGLHVARIAKGFGMKTLCFDITQNHFLADILNFEYASLETLLSRSDVISLHAPYLPSTYHLINLSNLHKIKNGAILINTARGELIENQAILEGLKIGKFSMACLDVIEGENQVDGLEAPIVQEIIQRDDVLFTPHLAYYTQEALDRILQTTADNIQSFLDKKTQNLVNKQG